MTINENPDIALFSGDPGTGKTRAALSFPKCYVICGGRRVDTILKANMVDMDQLAAETDEELKGLFRNTIKPEDRKDSLLGCLAHAKVLAADGAIETLIIDDFTFLANKLQTYIWKFEGNKTTGGEEDKRGNYGTLGMKLAYWVGQRISTVCSRNQLNMIFTCHLTRENEDQVMKKKLVTDLYPAVPGGYRYGFAGNFSSSLYFEAKAGKDQKTQLPTVQYLAHCQPSQALGTKLQAKNAWGIKTPMDLTGKSLYEMTRLKAIA